MGAAWPHKLVFRVKRRLKSIFSCNQKTAIKRKHKTATQHSGRDLERRSKGAGRWRYFVPQAQNNAGTKRTLLRRDKMLQYRYFKFSIGYLEDHPTALLGRGAFAPHECFAAGKTSAQAEFTSAEDANIIWGPQTGWPVWGDAAPVSMPTDNKVSSITPAPSADSSSPPPPRGGGWRVRRDPPAPLRPGRPAQR